MSPEDLGDFDIQQDTWVKHFVGDNTTLYHTDIRVKYPPNYDPARIWELETLMYGSIRSIILGHISQYKENK